MTIQFKHRSNIPKKFKFIAINEFTELKIPDLNFKEFVNVFSKME